EPSCQRAEKPRARALGDVHRVVVGTMTHCGSSTWATSDGSSSPLPAAACEYQSPIARLPSKAGCVQGLVSVRKCLCESRTASIRRGLPPARRFLHGQTAFPNLN